MTIRFVFCIISMKLCGAADFGLIKIFDVRKRLKQAWFVWGALFYMKAEHIIIADGDTLSATEIKSILEKNGYIVDSVVGDGIDAVAECSEKSPDVLFIKDNTEFMDGFGAASCLKSRGFSGTIFIMSDSYDPEMTQKALSAGAEGCIVKPVTEKFLIPWLYTKLTRTKDITRLSEEKKNLLASLEEKRLIEEANGIIASSAGITIPEADKILSKKAEAGGISREQLARMLVSSLLQDNK